ncbi:hypothetical protein ACSQ67_000688 [Phaseolus vulgaris]
MLWLSLLVGESFKGVDDLVCYTWGNNNHGQLGLGDKENRPRLEVVKTFDLESPWVIYEQITSEPVKELPQNVHLVYVDCGLFHTCVVSFDGYVWSWGMEKGLGLCPDDSNGGIHSVMLFLPILSHAIHMSPNFQNQFKLHAEPHTLLLLHKRDTSFGLGVEEGVGFLEMVRLLIVTLPPLCYGLHR